MQIQSHFWTGFLGQPFPSVLIRKKKELAKFAASELSYDGKVISPGKKCMFEEVCSK